MLMSCEKIYTYNNGSITFGNYATKAMINTGPNSCGYDTFNVFSEEANMNPYIVQ
jgi:hypothetical protein